MPKRNRSKKMRGGLFGYFEGKEEKPAYGSTSEKGWMDSATSMFSSKPAPPANKPYIPPPSNNSYSEPPSNNSYSAPANNSFQSPGYGGKRRRHKSRRMRGGYSDNVSMTNLASRAASFSGETARPQAYVGGRRTKRRCHTHKRSRRRHCRK
jgi:hypothetical protein